MTELLDCTDLIMKYKMLCIVHPYDANKMVRMMTRLWWTMFTV